ncbi:MAG: electron transfer flavoprotein subunit alpha/FixB family protein [Candidatus Asgardarchaeia archaeon]
MDEYKGVLVFAEQNDGKIHPISFELISKAREIADKKGYDVYSVLLGYRMKEKAKELIYFGADKVFLYDHPSLEEFDVINYKVNIMSLIEEERPEVVLIGATPLGRSLAPRIAAALKTGLTADCIDLKLDEDGDLIQVRPAFTGNLIAHIKTMTRPVMATVRYKVFRARSRNPDREGEVIEREVKILEDTGIKVIRKEEMGVINVSDAEIIVSGGRGIKRREDLKILGELAKLLGGVVGASRPLVDNGWISKDHQVGFSGNIVRPKLYIACGISGSPQHLAGMRGSEVIVAINIDPSAPIFNVSDYGIVGDLYEVIPKLIERLRNMKRGVRI